MGINVDAHDHELGEVLKRERRHLIPTYQRDYEWTEEGQWQLLADDVLGVADQLLQARSISMEHDTNIVEAEKQVGAHFLGAVVLEALPPRGAHIASCAVIDGQQRFTTLHLLLRGLLDVLQRHEAKLRARQIRKMLLIDEDDVIDSEEVFKLWPRRRDRDAWRAAMGDIPPADSHLYTIARAYFADRFAAELDDTAADSQASFLEALVDALSYKIKLVVVDLDSSDDAQLIFEVLNGRQTPLSATDLVKNLLFMRADVDEEALDSLYDEYWSHFDDEWWSGSVGRGHASRGRRDQLLATWLTVKTGDEVNLGRLYGEARSYLTNTDTELPIILSDIRDLALEYRRIYERTADVQPSIAMVYRRLEKLGVTTAVPLLAWLRTTQSEKRLSRAQHRRAVAAIDSFVMRRLITGGQTRGYGRAFLEVLRESQAADESKPIDEAVITALSSSPYGLDWPDDEEMRTEITERSYYGRISQERIRMILGPIDSHLQQQRNKGEQATFDYDALTIEHIMPREWTSNWPVKEAEPAEKMLAEQLRQRHIHRIGNLTLVTDSLNPSLSNSEWPTKRKELQKYSSLVLNSEVHGEEVWNEETITKRATALAETACQVWQRPRAVRPSDEPA